MLYLSLLVTPQFAAAHAPHLTPLADSQFEAISPLTGQASLTSEQDSSDDNDNSLQVGTNPTALNLNPLVSTLPASIALAQAKAAHPVRAPPLYSFS